MGSSSNPIVGVGFRVQVTVCRYHLRPHEKGSSICVYTRRYIGFIWGYIYIYIHTGFRIMDSTSDALYRLEFRV